MTREISNTDDIIDARDVIERIAELEDALQVEHEHHQETEPDFEKWLEKVANLDEAYSADAVELQILRAFRGEFCSHWEDGESLIRESYFKDYAMDLAQDIGAISKNAGWPCGCIDWEQAARELKMDYTGADFDGVTYYGHA